MKKNLLTKSNTSIKEAMKSLNNTSEKCLFIIDETERLIGTLTDGDLRRHILKYQDLEGTILDAFNRNPVYFRN